MSLSSGISQRAMGLALAMISSYALAAPFTYEGSLSDLGQPASGRFDLRLSAQRHEERSTTLTAPDQ